MNIVALNLDWFYVDFSKMSFDFSAGNIPCRKKRIGAEMAAAINYLIKFNEHYILTTEFMYIYPLPLENSVRKSEGAMNVSD